MNGPSQNPGSESALQISWPDAEFESIEVCFDHVALCILESAGTKVEIQCCRYIGFEYVGDWNDSVIESATLCPTGEFLERCLQEASKRPVRPPWSESKEPVDTALMQLSLTFGDQARLSIVAHEYRVNRERGR